jgi:hypothetical protein
MKDKFDDYEPISDESGRDESQEGFNEGFREDTFFDRLRTLGWKIKNRIRTGRPKPYFSDELIEQYEFFRNNIYEPHRVFYPCCNLDASAVRGFPNSEVVLVDREKSLEKIMKKAKLKQFTLGDVLEYIPPTPFDLVIALNPCLSSKDLTKYLVEGGYILANNYHNNASELLENNRFEGVGTIDGNERGLFLAKGDFSKLEPNQWENYFYVFRKLGGKTK